MDWNQIGNDLVMASIKYLLPVLITMLIGWVGLLIRTEWDNIVAKRPDLIKEVQLYAPTVAHYVEQMRKQNLIPSEVSIEEFVESNIDAYLKAKGFNVDLTPYWSVIHPIVEAEVNKLPSFNGLVTTTNSVSTIESNPSKDFAPVNTHLGDVSNLVKEVVAEVPSVVTTTTETVVSNNTLPETPVVVDVTKVDDTSPAPTDLSVPTDGSVG